MARVISYIRCSLVFRLIIIVGLTVILSISLWAFFNIRNFKAQNMKAHIASTDRLSNSIKLGTHYAMMLNSRDDINQIINNIAKQPEIENIRIYNKYGQIKFTNQPHEMDQVIDIKAVACDICHKLDPAPPSDIPLFERTRIFQSPEGHRLLGVIQPIYNDPGCSSSQCHFHSRDQTILGALDVVVSLKHTDQQVVKMEKGVFKLAVSTILVTSVIIFFTIFFFVKKPIIKLVEGTRRIARGDYEADIDIGSAHEIRPLGEAIRQMGKKIGRHQAALRKQKNEYQALFENAPCMIAVQDRHFQLLQYNRAFRERFDPRPKDFCYTAYKGMDEKCPDCPVEKTFADGRSHYGEAEGMGRQGQKKHWIFITAPIMDESGNITAAMEMSIDITRRRNLEKDLEKSEEKYHAIFNNIFNPVFVVDQQTLKILDCNIKAMELYHPGKADMTGKLFTDFFPEDEQTAMVRQVKSQKEISKVRHVKADGQMIDVDMWVAPARYSGQDVFLITINDITRRLQTEQHLLHASKMATLGEMSTGIAHELNQPLSVIKSSASFCLKKIHKKEPLPEEIFNKLIGKIDTNVDRAEKIIQHMRQFARKSDIKLVRTRINDVLGQTFEMFNQQLKIRGIQVVWEKKEDLPDILADPDRLEQVFINLVMNAKDAIEAKWEAQGGGKDQTDRIIIQTFVADGNVVVKVRDTGPGIEKKIRDRLFEPFFTTKEVGRGTGLGLSISYGIIKECNGDIRAGRGQEGGAEFTLVFPVPELPEDEIEYA
ncbi:MAG: PAS domain S-box protein [Desulfotignum sp.]|nr:PAS domain S-box protein [Desulfotignum sp.]MCF8112739.1 PAS domain S-box protein [Desulfotignum sp.]